MAHLKSSYMQRQSVFLLAVFITIGSMRSFAGDEKNTVPSTLKSATVYRSGAELVHTATAVLKQGNNELWIEDISNNIDPSSIQVTCSGNVTIMSVAFSTEYLKPEISSPLVRKWQDSIEAVKKELSRNDIQVKSDQELLDLLNANKSIAGTQTGLSVTELSKMVDYYRQKQTELRTDLGNCQEKAIRLNKLIEKMESQLKEEEKKNSKTSGRIVLQLLSPMPVTADLTVSYMTPAAYWNPLYDLRVDNSNDPLRVLFKAKLVQTSGIDWKHVKLSLSTSTPSQRANAPTLKTWFLQFTDPVVMMDEELKSNTLSGSAAGLQYQQFRKTNEVVVMALGVSRRDKDEQDSDNREPLYIVNGREISAAEFEKIDQRAFKNMEKMKPDAAKNIYGSRASGGAVVATLKDELGDYVAVNDKQADMTFDIDIPYDVPGNGKEQGIVLKEYKTPCTFQYYAAPRLDKDAFLLGQLPDWEKLNLLPGEANIILEGTYAGKTFIDPNSTMDTLNLTLGTDKKVVVKREKVADFSSVKFLGNNKKQVFTYEITVRNNKREKIKMLLKDQHPISSSKDIEEVLLESSGARVNDETGVLTWQIELAPGESKKFRISYSVKYPKDKTLNIN
jgi:uncharacterized protein DUF4139/uncharacterized protein DUF4140